MKILQLLLFSLLIASALTAQQDPITNVRISVSEERDKVTITYDLARNARIPYYNIVAELWLGGREVSNPRGLSGDLGSEVRAGFGKKIIWDTRKDITSLAGELKVDVITTSTPGGDNPGGPCAPIKTVPVVAGLGGVGVAGLGLLVSGLGQLGQSNDLYEVYANQTNPNAAVYSEISRTEHYEDANAKHKNGTWLAVGGGAVLAAGSAVLIGRLLKIKAYNQRCQERMSASPVPLPAHQPYFKLETNTSAGPGLAVVFRF